MQKRGGTDNLIRNYQWSSHHRAGLKCGRHGVAVRIHVIDEHRAAAANRFHGDGTFVSLEPGSAEPFGQQAIRFRAN